MLLEVIRHIFSEVNILKMLYMLFNQYLDTLHGKKHTYKRFEL